MNSTSNNFENMQIMLFPKPKDWEDWLHENHAASSGVWLRIAKKASDVQSVTYSEALDIALCYGWIDGQRKSYDEQSWLW